MNYYFCSRTNSGSQDSKNNSKVITERSADDKINTSFENNEKDDGVKLDDSSESQASFVDLLV